MKVLSLFSNIGVAEAYLSEIGVDVVLANELVERRASLYSQIYPETKMICGDITSEQVYKSIVDTAKSLCVDTMFNNYISTLATVHPGRPYEKDGETLYSDPRALSVYELFIVMSIPLDWPIPDWVDDSFLRFVIGEGIPSKMARDIVNELIIQLNLIGYQN